MKTTIILSLCLTTSLSFAHSKTQDKVKDDVFTYDDSGLCEGIPNCYPSMKNLPEIDDNSQFPPMPLRVGKSASACGASFGSNFSFIIAGADGKSITYSASNKKIDAYEAIYNKYSALGFSSKADANAYFNIHILNNTPNNQLGNLRWITYDFNLAIDQDASTVELHKNSYLLHFGTTITKQLAHQKGLKILYIQDLKKTTTNLTAVQPYIIIPQLFKVFNNSIVGLSDSSLSIVSSSPRHTSNDRLESFYPTTCLYKTKEPISIIQQPKNQIISTKIMNFVHEQINDWYCPEAFAKTYPLYLIPIQTPSKIYAQTNQTGSYSIVNQNENEEQAFICPKIPDEIRSIADLEKKHGCQQVHLVPSSSIEIKPQ